MVTRDNACKALKNQVKNADIERIIRIGPDTPYGECREPMSAFGGLLALNKFLDLIGFERIISLYYIHPERSPKLGGYKMILGILMLLFIGFQRIGQMAYIRTDVMLCGIMRVATLPVVSTFWRYLKSLTIVQSNSLLRLGGELRARVWELCNYQPRQVSINIDTTVSTVYGNIEGARKGHNTKHRGKLGLRPVLCFLEETREYLCGTQRRGQTITSVEVANQIRKFRGLLPDCVHDVHVRGDGEFIGKESISACIDGGFTFTFGNKVCAPAYPDAGWYRYGEYEYNEGWYQPSGWGQPHRFVVMRIRKDQLGDRQLKLLESENYVLREFVTNARGRPHVVIEDYDKRADVENLIAESQKEGLLAIPSKRFQTNYAFFQLVMLAYNLWRWMKIMAMHAQTSESSSKYIPSAPIAVLPSNTARIARLKMLFIAAKIRYHGNRDEVLYSIHEQRAAGLIHFLKYLDRRRKEAA